MPTPGPANLRGQASQRASKKLDMRALAEGERGEEGGGRRKVGGRRREKGGRRKEEHGRG
jgi:hypothetical protein